MAIISMKALLESGVHFGHRTNRWHPKMKPYIFTERNGIHIIDLQQTVKSINEVYGIVSKTVANGGEILFVGTKRQAQQTVADEASRCGMPYVNERWLGGSLTNWPTIYLRIQELERLEALQASGEVELLTKKEGLMIQRQIDRLHHRLSGLLTMKKVPQILFVVDIGREQAAIHEANLLKIPVIAMADTNYDPRYIDYVIPSNDDAIRAIKLIVGTMANAVLEGKSARQEEEAEAQAAAEAMPAKEAQHKEVAPVADASDLSDEELLGAATLEKMNAEREAAEAQEEKAASEAEEVKEEEKAAPKAEEAKEEEKAVPEAEEAKEEEKAAPKAEETKEEKAAPKSKKAPAKKKAAPKSEKADEEKKAAPKAKKAPAKKKAAPKAEEAKEEKKAAPKAKKAPAKKKAAPKAKKATKKEKADKEEKAE